MDAVNDGEGEFAFGDVVADALFGGVFVALQVFVVVADLEDYAEGVGQGDIVSAVRLESGEHLKDGEGGMWEVRRTGTHFVQELSSIMSRIASRKRPLVLLLTMLMYSASVGQMDRSRQ